MGEAPASMELLIRELVAVGERFAVERLRWMRLPEYIRRREVDGALSTCVALSALHEKAGRHPRSELDFFNEPRWTFEKLFDIGDVERSRRARLASPSLLVRWRARLSGQRAARRETTSYCERLYEFERDDAAVARTASERPVRARERARDVIGLIGSAMRPVNFAVIAYGAIVVLAIVLSVGHALYVVARSLLGAI